jgi:DNA-binding NtrC family response regulator
LASAVHQKSRRSSGPFVVVDCSAIPPTLVESELFGHVKGAFTGAHESRAGSFEAAAGGTVFLDEIGELPLEMQPKLLRALEERTVKRIGSTATVPLDLRIIAATTRDLTRDVERGTFRADLFYRLNGLRIRVPPLRERREDIPLLIAHFYEQVASKPGARPPSELVQSLLHQAWPGNVRELRSAVERSVLLTDNEVAQLYVEPTERRVPDFGAPLPFRTAKARVMASWESDYLKSLIALTKGNVSAAARLARMDRNHLRELLLKHNVVCSSG